MPEGVIQEGVHYLQTGWRPGDVATLENRPSARVILDAWNAHPDKRAFNTAHRDLLNELMIGYEAALSPELKVERSRLFEEKMMADAAEFYRNRQPGDNRSFWD